MRSVWFLALAATGCRGILGIELPPPPADAAAGGSDAPSFCASWSPEGFMPCALTITAPSLPIDPSRGAYTYDTGDGGGTLFDAAHTPVLHSDQTITTRDGTIVAVLSLGEISLPAAATLNVIGPHPLLLVSWSAITIEAGAAIDAGSHLGVVDAALHKAQTVRFGPGADQACTVGAALGPQAGKPGGDADQAGSGGGGGGALRARGGRGGAAGAVVAGDGGEPLSSDLAGVIRGGCPGGTSGAIGAVAATRGEHAQGGSGGGAIRLAAYSAIDVRGTIAANGAGGAGGLTRSAAGGGGGGSGGYIGFDAPMLHLAGTITANGGGGGAGANTDGPGNDGGDGDASAEPAPGGAIATNHCGQAGGAGGTGASAAADATSETACTGGGGGGGGATGYIFVAASTVLSVEPTAIVSPMPTQPQTQM